MKTLRIRLPLRAIAQVWCDRRIEKLGVVKQSHNEVADAEVLTWRCSVAGLPATTTVWNSCNVAGRINCSEVACQSCQRLLFHVVCANHANRRINNFRGIRKGRTSESLFLRQWSALENDSMDKASDLKLIADNWSILLPAAERAFEEHGRGMLLVDTTRIENSGHPFQYVRMAALPGDNSDCDRMVRTYDPEKEIIVSLFRSDGKVYSYELGRPGETKVSRP